MQRPYLLTYSYDTVLLYSLGCIHQLPTCQTLITLITLVTESFLTICTDNVNGPFVAPHVPLPLTDTIQLPVNGPCKSRYLAKTLSVQQCYPWKYSYIIVFLYSLVCIQTLPTCQTLITLITLIIESFFIIWTDNVNAICATTISSNIQLWYCIAVFPGLYPCNTYLPNTDFTNYTGYRVVFNHLHRKRWLPSTGIHFFHLAVGTSSRSAHSFTESK